MAGWYGQHGGVAARYSIHISVLANQPTVHSGDVKRGGVLAVGVGDRSQVTGDM